MTPLALEVCKKFSTNQQVSEDLEMPLNYFSNSSKESLMEQTCKHERIGDSLLDWMHIWTPLLQHRERKKWGWLTDSIGPEAVWRATSLQIKVKAR